MITGVPGEEPGDTSAFREVERIVDSEELGGDDGPKCATGMAGLGLYR